MGMCNFAADTQRAHLQQASGFAEYFGRSPALLIPEETRAFSRAWRAEALVHRTALNP
jgi:integrase/recombinase XerD